MQVARLVCTRPLLAHPRCARAVALEPIKTPWVQPSVSCARVSSVRSSDLRFVLFIRYSEARSVHIFSTMFASDAETSSANCKFTSISSPVVCGLNQLSEVWWASFCS